MSAAIPGGASPASEDEVSDRRASSSGRLARLQLVFGSWLLLAAIGMLVLVACATILAPWLGTVDPTELAPGQRLRPVSADHWFGTDSFGRDVYSRVLYGARTSLLIGLGATCLALLGGVAIGVVAGYFRWVDSILMRVIDGLMAIPGILLAIALVSLFGSSLTTVLVAISVPEIPRVVRLVRAVILGIRAEPYVEVAVTLGTRFHLMIWRHLLPNVVPPLIVQGTYIFASAILTEAVLSFLGAGIPPEIPSWGNIMAEGRIYFQLLPGLILFPGAMVSLTVLSVNLLGDGARDALDPRTARRV